MSCPVWVCLEQVHMHTNSHSSRKPLPSQHLLSINEGLAGGPCFGTPPKLHSFKKRPWWSQECFSFSSREDNVETYTVRWDRGLFSPLSPPFYLIFSVFRVMSPPHPPKKLGVRRYATSVEERPKNAFQMTFSWQVVRPLISLALFYSSGHIGDRGNALSLSVLAFCLSLSVRPSESILLSLAPCLFFFYFAHPLFPTTCMWFSVLLFSPLFFFFFFYLYNPLFKSRMACRWGFSWKHTSRELSWKRGNTAGARYSGWFSSINWRDPILKSWRDPTSSEEDLRHPTPLNSTLKGATSKPLGLSWYPTTANKWAQVSGSTVHLYLTLLLLLPLAKSTKSTFPSMVTVVGGSSVLPLPLFLGRYSFFFFALPGMIYSHEASPSTDISCEVPLFSFWSYQPT